VTSQPVDSGRHGVPPVSSPFPALTATIDELPIALTVPEAAAVLRVGRNKVYDLVHQWEATSGAAGLRSVSLGRSVRIPRAAVLEFLGIVSPQSDRSGI